MARNDIVLLDSLFEKVKSRLSTKHSDSEKFGPFCFEQVLKDYDPTYDELESGWADGPDDGGIDGFFVLLDTNFATSNDTTRASKLNPRIDVFIVAVKRRNNFQQPPINALLASVRELFGLTKRNKDLSHPFNEHVLRQREIFYEIYTDLAGRRPLFNINVLYCCRGEVNNLSRNITSRILEIEEEIKKLFSKVNAVVSPIGATELLEIARREKTYSLRLSFVENYISREKTNYVVLATLPKYYDFISDDKGNLRRYLFESNVRDYLGEVQINKDIKETLESDSQRNSADFWWLNNGVTLIATHATVAGKELSLENVQIVNGLQTTEAIYQHFNAKGNNNDNRAILIKVILANDDEIRDRIIKSDELSEHSRSCVYKRIG